METKQNEKLIAFGEALLHTHPLDRIPRPAVIAKVRETLCYQQRLSRLCGPSKRTQVQSHIPQALGFQVDSHEFSTPILLIRRGRF